MEVAVRKSTLSKRARVEKQAYTMAEFAGLFGRSYTSVQEAARRGELPVTPIRVGRSLMFPKPIVDRLLGIEPTHAGGGDDAAA